VLLSLLPPLAMPPLLLPLLAMPPLAMPPPLLPAPLAMLPAARCLLHFCLLLRPCLHCSSCAGESLPQQQADDCVLGAAAGGNCLGMRLVRRHLQYHAQNCHVVNQQFQEQAPVANCSTAVAASAGRAW
jgi:hypothetical protein